MRPKCINKRDLLIYEHSDTKRRSSTKAMPRKLHVLVFVVSSVINAQAMLYRTHSMENTSYSIENTFYREHILKNKEHIL